MEKDYKKLKFKVVLSIIIVISIVAGVRLYDDITSHKQNMIEKNELATKQFNILFENKLKEVDSYLKARLSGIAKLNAIKDLEKNNRDALYKKANFRFSVITKENPNVARLHFLKPGAISFLRVYRPKVFGDYMGEKQPMLKELEKTKITQYGFAYGLSDAKSLSYRVARALFNENGKYIGIVLIAYDFKNDVEKINKLLSNFYNIDNFVNNEVLIKKSLLKYKIHNDKEVSLFIDDYKLTYDIKNKVIKYILNHNKDIKNNHIDVDNKDYFIYKNYDLLKDYRGEDVGLVVSVFNNTKEVQKYYKKVIQAILKPVVVLILIIFLLNFLFNRFIKDSIKISNRKNLILDAQENIIIVTDGEHIKETNNTFLQFFGFQSLEEFSKKYNCICDKFLDDLDSNYLETIDKDGKLWDKVVLNNKSTLHKVLMEDSEGKKYIFKVTGEKLESEEVIVFSDITLLEKQKQESLDAQEFIQEQSKNAQMGEMIGNIAHQWRQPLSVISTGATGMLMQKEYGMLTDEIFNKSCNLINDNANFLSDTIDTFRDYIKEKKELKEVVLQDRLNNAINIIEASLKNNYIKIINNIDNSEPMKITMVVGELSQVIINLLNNAKDILVDNNIDDPFIEINLTNRENTAIITIEDNGGGIPEDILPKIFDPYFTTKHQSQGTGLGLHISKDIIEKHLQGKLYAQNLNGGAIFTIELPLNNV
ncbi:MAG: GHKL domain-containing protein [Arcobacteraceae bacterium]|nr:GHKL domain-containing protein [Arcobacteraceae bacterium]